MSFKESMYIVVSTQNEMMACWPYGARSPPLHIFSKFPFLFFLIIFFKKTEICSGELRDSELLSGIKGLLFSIQEFSGLTSPPVPP